jgi:hypothetical protein
MKSIWVVLIALPLLVAGCSSAHGDAQADSTPSPGPNKPEEVRSVQTRCFSERQEYDGS